MLLEIWHGQRCGCWTLAIRRNDPPHGLGLGKRRRWPGATAAFDDGSELGKFQSMVLDRAIDGHEDVLPIDPVRIPAMQRPKTRKRSYIAHV